MQHLTVKNIAYNNSPYKEDSIDNSSMGSGIQVEVGALSVDSMNQVAVPL